MSVQGLRAQLFRGATHFNEADVKELLDRIDSDTQTITYLQEQGTTQVTRIRELEQQVRDIELPVSGRAYQDLDRLFNENRRLKTQIMDLQGDVIRLTQANTLQGPTNIMYEIAIKERDKLKQEKNFIHIQFNDMFAQRNALATALDKHREKMRKIVVLADTRL